MEEIIIGDIYRHYKGNRYKVIAEGKHTETGEELVVYKDANYSEYSVWIRPKAMFFERVRDAEGVIVPRFEHEGADYSDARYDE